MIDLDVFHQIRPVANQSRARKNCRDTVSSHCYHLANYTLFVYSYVSSSPISMKTPDCDLTIKSLATAHESKKSRIFQLVNRSEVGRDSVYTQH